MNDNAARLGGSVRLSLEEFLDLTFVGFSDAGQEPTHVAMDFRPMVPLLDLPADFPAVIYMSIDGSPIEATPVEGIAWATLWDLSETEMRRITPHISTFLETMLADDTPHHSVH